MTKGNNVLNTRSTPLLRCRNTFGEDGNETSETFEEVVYRRSSEKESRPVKETANDRTGALRVPIRKLAFAILVLLLACHLLVFSVWRSGMAKKRAREKPLISGWKLDTKTVHAKVRLRANEDARAVAYVSPGTEVEAVSFNSNEYLHLVEPVSGFVSKKLFKPSDSDGYASPWMYEGFRLAGRNRNARYSYGPTLLVVAQQLWNAVQVLHVLLVICLYYQHFILAPHRSVRVRVVIGTTTIALHCLLLPFSIYAASPGAVAFAIVAYITAVVGLLSRTDMEVSVSDEASHTDVGDTTLEDEESLSSVATASKEKGANTLPLWYIVKEETLGLLCNLASSLYNYHGSRSTWPHWESQFLSVDKFLGWTGGNGEYLEVLDQKVYTLGLVDHVPMFVPRAVGSTFGSHLFWILWAFIPVLYVSYFLVMYVLAERSPGVKVQRALLLFAIFHFLFMTDVVSYKYGRGLWTPHMELFHWFERWAWRIAVLLPIYQNFTAGHWMHGHRWSLVGTIFHYVVGCWGCLFFVFQVLFSDVVRFVCFLSVTEEKTMYDILGVNSLATGSFRPLSYHGGLVVMWVMYLVLLVGGFLPFYVSVRASSEPEQRISRRRRSKRFCANMSRRQLSTQLPVLCCDETCCRILETRLLATR